MYGFIYFRFPCLLLHGRQSNCALESSVRPPLLQGSMWSTVSSSSKKKCLQSSQRNGAVFILRQQQRVVWPAESLHLFGIAQPHVVVVHIARNIFIGECRSRTDDQELLLRLHHHVHKLTNLPSIQNPHTRNDAGLLA